MVYTGCGAHGVVGGGTRVMGSGTTVRTLVVHRGTGPGVALSCMSEGRCSGCHSVGTVGVTVSVHWWLQGQSVLQWWLQGQSVLQWWLRCDGVDYSGGYGVTVLTTVVTTAASLVTTVASLMTQQGLVNGGFDGQRIGVHCGCLLDHENKRRSIRG